MTDLLAALGLLGAAWCGGGLHGIWRVRQESSRWHAWAHALVIEDQADDKGARP